MPRSLTHKLTLGSVVFLILTAGVALLALISVRSINNAITHLTEYTADQAHLHGHFEAGVFRAIAEAGSFERTRKPEFREETEEVLEKLEDTVTALGMLDATMPRSTGTHLSRTACRSTARSCSIA